MLSKKTLLALSAISFFALNVQAVEKTQPTKAPQNAPAQKQQKLEKQQSQKQQNQKQQNQKQQNKKQQEKKPEQQTEESSLKAFNQNVSISLIQRAVATENNQNIVVLLYEVSNKGKNKIKNLNWVSAFTVENQVFFVQEVKTELSKPIAVKKKENITVTFPLDNLPEPAKQIFASKDVPVGHLTVAKQIDFTNGKKIVVKEKE